MRPSETHIKALAEGYGLLHALQAHVREEGGAAARDDVRQQGDAVAHDDVEALRVWVRVGGCVGWLGLR